MLGPLGRLPYPQSAGPQQAVTRVGALVPGSQGAPAARPDGTGRALALYQLSFVDAWREERLGLFGDAYFLSDRRTGPAFKPTQASWLAGAALDDGAWRLEAGREEHRPVGSSGARYQAWRTTLVRRWGGSAAAAQAASVLPTGFTYQANKGRPALEGDWGLGWYFLNKSLPARLDRGGVQHLRYALHASYGAPAGLWRVLGSLEAPTTGARWGVAEVDASVGGALRWKGGELALTREVRQAVDQRGFAAWWQAAASWSFGPPPDTP